MGPIGGHITTSTSSHQGSISTPPGDVKTLAKQVGEALEIRSSQPLKPSGSKIQSKVKRSKIPHLDSKDSSSNIVESFKKHTETFRDFTMFVKTTAHNILRLDRLADVSYGGATLGVAGAQGFADVSSHLDMYASASNVLASGISCVLKGVTVYKYKKTVRALKKGNLTGQERKILERKKQALKEEVKSAPEWIKLGAGTLASVSYFTGSVIALTAPAQKALAAGFGSIGFGVLYAISKGVELRQNVKQFKAVRKEMKEYKAKYNAAQDGALKEMYKMKMDALHQKCNSKCKLNMLQNSVDILVGATATAAGVTALIPGANVVAAPLAVALGVSLACKVGIAAYRNLRNPAARHRSKLALEKKVLNVKIFFSRGSKRQDLESKLDVKRGEYNKAWTSEQTAKSERHVSNNIGKFMQENSAESKDFKQSIAEEMGLFDDNGNPDITQVTPEVITKWLGL